jgi:hypothetical protein
MSVIKMCVATPAIFLFALVLILSGCAKRAVVIHTTHDLGMANADRVSLLGSSGPNKDIEALCGGDLEKILTASSLDNEQKAKVRLFICGKEKDAVSKFRAFYYSLSDELRIDLMHAFASYGYHIRGFC